MPAQGTVGAGFFEKLADFQAPSQLECVNHLGELRLVVTVPLAIFGVVYLLLGWKLHKPLVAANAIIAGAIIGNLLGDLAGNENPNVPIFGSIAGGLLLGALAILLTHGAVSLMGVLVGAAMGFGAWVYASRVFDNPALIKYPWAGALVGLVALGLLAYANFRLAVMIFTSFQGAVMVVAGTIAMLLLNENTAPTIRQTAETNVHFLAALVLVPALLGFAIQHVSRAKVKKPKG